MKVTYLIPLFCFLLFTSCEKDTETIISNEITFLTDKSNANAVAEFAVQHVNISEQIFDLLKSESSVDLVALQDSRILSQDVEEARNSLVNAGVKNVKALTALLRELSANSDAFIKTNPDFYALDESARLSILSAQVDNHLNIRNLDKQTCSHARARAEGRCVRNYAIAMVAATASGVISFGWGTVIGLVAAHAMEVVCIVDAQNDYEACIGG